MDLRKQKSEVTKLQYLAALNRSLLTARKIPPPAPRLAAKHVAALAPSGHSIRTRISAISRTLVLDRMHFVLTELTLWLGPVEASSLSVLVDVLLYSDENGVT